jgi:hypothetical protein
MKLKSLLSVGLLILVATWFSGCATTPEQPKLPLGPNEARITGQKGTLTNVGTVLMAPAGQLKEAGWKNELIIPAGPNRLAIRYQAVLGGGLMGGLAEAYNTGEIEFVAEAGHEYAADIVGISIFTFRYKVTDKATGKVVVETKAHQKKE